MKTLHRTFSRRTRTFAVDKPMRCHRPTVDVVVSKPGSRSQPTSSSSGNILSLSFPWPTARSAIQFSAGGTCFLLSHDGCVRKWHHDCCFGDAETRGHLKEFSPSEGPGKAVDSCRFLRTSREPTMTTPSWRSRIDEGWSHLSHCSGG